jgi:hypothetical protein
MMELKLCGTNLKILHNNRYFWGKKVPELMFNNASLRGSTVIKICPMYCHGIDTTIINTEDHPKILKKLLFFCL